MEIHLRRYSAVLALMLVAGCSGDSPTSLGPVQASVSCDDPAPLVVPGAAPGMLVPNEYAVFYTDEIANADSLTEALATRLGFTPRYRWSSDGFRGFSGHLAPGIVAALRCEPAVKLVEQQQLFRLGTG